MKLAKRIFAFALSAVIAISTVAPISSKAMDVVKVEKGEGAWVLDQEKVRFTYVENMVYEDTVTKYSYDKNAKLQKAVVTRKLHNYGQDATTKVDITFDDKENVKEYRAYSYVGELTEKRTFKNGLLSSSYVVMDEKGSVASSVYGHNDTDTAIIWEKTTITKPDGTKEYRYYQYTRDAIYGDYTLIGYECDDSSFNIEGKEPSSYNNAMSCEETVAVAYLNRYALYMNYDKKVRPGDTVKKEYDKSKRVNKVTTKYSNPALDDTYVIIDNFKYDKNNNPVSVKVSAANLVKSETDSEEDKLKVYHSFTNTLTWKFIPEQYPVGKTAKVDGYTYKVTKAVSSKVTIGEVMLIAPKKGAKKIIVPNSIKLAKKTYKVTSIKPALLKNNKTVTSLTIGKYVNKIGKNAFYGCSKLKTVTVNTTKLTKANVERGAFAKLHNKVVIKVPKTKKKAYTELFKARGVKGKYQKIVVK